MHGCESRRWWEEVLRRPGEAPEDIHWRYDAEKTTRASYHALVILIRRVGRPIMFLNEVLLMLVSFLGVGIALLAAPLKAGHQYTALVLEPI